MGRRVAGEVGAKVGPERHRLEGVVITRGRQAGGIGAQGEGGVGERGGIAERVPDQRLDRGFLRRQAAGRAQGEGGVGEIAREGRAGRGRRRAWRAVIASAARIAARSARRGSVSGSTGAEWAAAAASQR